MYLKPLRPPLMLPPNIASSYRAAIDTNAPQIRRIVCRD
jgi:hypothetical protein